jgi:hypothetical protein
MADSAFQTGLDLPDLSRPEVVEHSVEGTRHHLVLRYEYVGQLDSLAKGIVGNRRLTWVQELTLDVERGEGELRFSADDDAGRVNGSASVAIVATGDAACRRTIDGDFRIRIPVVGGTAERRVVPGLVRRLEVEADALDAATRGAS